MARRRAGGCAAVEFAARSLPVATVFMYCTAQMERRGEICRFIVAFPSPSPLTEVLRGSPRASLCADSKA
jgi:hypothetical protein